MTRQTEDPSAAVPKRATQVEEVRGRWPFAEPSVWTERMLLALERGVKGGKWFSLVDKVYLRTNLEAAFEAVRRNQGGAGVDQMTVQQFETHRALRLDKLAEWLQDGSYRPKPGHSVVVDADLKSYFDTIPHDRLMERVEEKISDGRVLALIRLFLEQQVMDEAKSWTPEEGTPQGAVISPLLANIYLNPLDHLMADRGFEMVRYADDFVILCRSAEEADEALELVRSWTEQVGLTLHPTKTRVVDSRTADFEFLGYRFSKGTRWPRNKSLARLKDTIRAKTGRRTGLALVRVILDLNRTLGSWYAYFKHAHWPAFEQVDGFVRRRLRSILRSRLKKGKGGGRRYAKGNDNRRWPNAFFERLGLFSLLRAWRRTRQPVLTANH